MFLDSFYTTIPHNHASNNYVFDFLKSNLFRTLCFGVFSSVYRVMNRSQVASRSQKKLSTVYNDHFFVIDQFLSEIDRCRPKLANFLRNWPILCPKLTIFHLKWPVDIINTIWTPQITDIAWNITSIWDIDIKEMKTSADIGSYGVLWGLDRFWYAKIIWFIASYSEYQKILWLGWRLYAKFFSRPSYSQITSMTHRHDSYR